MARRESESSAFEEYQSVLVEMDGGMDGGEFVGGRTPSDSLRSDTPRGVSPCDESSRLVCFMLS
jgi:hypothetical protein